MNHGSRVLLLAGSAISFAGCAASAQPCSPYWALPGSVLAPAQDLLVFDDGTGLALYANRVPDPTNGGVGGVARWDGRQWTLMPAGLPPHGQMFPLLSLDIGFGNRLFAGGTNPAATSYWMVFWADQTWQPAPATLFSTQGLLGPKITFDDGSGLATYGLQCAPATGCLGNWVVRWTGTNWVPLGSPTNSTGAVDTLGGFNLGDGPHLYGGGIFSSLGGVAANGIAMWNGAAWKPLGAGASGIRAMCQYDDGRGPALYIGGSLLFAGGQPVRCIARWDGQSWSDVGGGITSGGIAQINSLATFDDGRGLALYASGYFTQMGGVNCRGIARWDGHAWEPLGNGITGPGNSFAVFDDGRGPSLFVGGVVGGAGGGVAGGLAQWVGCPNCYANCDNSTREPTLNVLDFICFLNKFAARDPYANCNVDATIDISDFLCFLNKFAAGCP